MVIKFTFKVSVHNYYSFQVIELDRLAVTLIVTFYFRPLSILGTYVEIHINNYEVNSLLYEKFNKCSYVHKYVYVGSYRGVHISKPTYICVTVIDVMQNYTLFYIKQFNQVRNH